MSKELLGDELRDIFAAHPPRALAPGESPKLDMTIYTAGEGARWAAGRGEGVCESIGVGWRFPCFVRLATWALARRCGIGERRVDTT